MSWWVGDRVSVDRLSLWHGLRLGSKDDADQALSCAGWALRRLSGGPAPMDAVGQFLERVPESGLRDRAEPDPMVAGVEFRADSGAVEDLTHRMAEIVDMHPVTQAAIVFYAWRLLGAPQTRESEAAVLAARHGAQMARRPDGAVFFPLAQGGQGTFRCEGAAQQKLAAWITGATQATFAALLHLEQIHAWHKAAQSSIADLSGRTPALILECLMRWPDVSAALVEAETGASRASCQRNIDLFVARGLIREVTGQGRYRLWTAKV